MVDGGTHGQPAGTWSDDTSMALCICSSIKQFGRVVKADITDRFSRWLECGDFTCDGHVFDVGVTCERAILTGVPAKSYDGCGNGSLMRTAPLALLDYFDTNKIREVSAITHALWCFLNTGSYADCVLAAVNLGGDTDTTAAVAGALAGVYYRFEAIPPKWIGQLRGKAVIDQCI